MDLNSSDEQSERERVVINAVAKVTHDLRVPLASIKISSDLLQKHRHSLSDTKIDAYLTRISTQVNLMAQMLENLSVLTKTGKVTLTNRQILLSALVDDIVRVSQSVHQSHQINLIDHSAGATIFGDEKLIYQIMNNLIQNAVKYSPNADRVDVCIAKEAENVKICVSDYGIGIPMDELSKIFATRFRAANVDIFSGTGLGLSVVKTSVDLLGGTINVTSSEGRGSTFTVSLPCTQ